MAMIEKRGGRWRARIRLNGQDLSETFRSKMEAKAWSARMESEILDGKRGAIPDKSLADLLKRYLAEVSIKKDGHRWEAVRIQSLCDNNPDPITY